MAEQKILITGVAGFIGSNLAKHLIGLGHNVVGIDDLNDLNDLEMKHARLASLGIDNKTRVTRSTNEGSFRFFKMSINDEARMTKLFAEHRFDAVVHLAAHAGVRNSLNHPQEFLRSNVLGSEIILRCCKKFGVTRFLFASSSSVYGERSGVGAFKETDNTDSPISVYAASKKAGELLAQAYSSFCDIEIIGLRFFTVYGPWVRSDMATYLFMDAIANDRPITLFNNGEMIRDFTYIDDVTMVLTKLLDARNKWTSSPFQIFNVGNETTVPLNDFVSTIERLMGRTAKKVFLPTQTGDVSNTHANTDRLREAVGYAPNTSIETGLAQTVSWYRTYTGMGQ